MPSIQLDHSCASINCTPHERLFNFQCRSTSDHSIPSWLNSPGPVLIKRTVCQRKYDPLVDEVDLIEVNPQYAHIRLPDGRETTVSTKQLLLVIDLYKRYLQSNNHLKRLKIPTLMNRYKKQTKMTLKNYVNRKLHLLTRAYSKSSGAP